MPGSISPTAICHQTPLARGAKSGGQMIRTKPSFLQASAMSVSAPRTFASDREVNSDLTGSGTITLSFKSDAELQAALKKLS